MADEDVKFKLEVKNEPGEDQKILFKPKKKKNLRQIKQFSDDEEDKTEEDTTQTL